MSAGGVHCEKSSSGMAARLEAVSIVRGSTPRAVHPGRNVPSTLH